MKNTLRVILIAGIILVAILVLVGFYSGKQAFFKDSIIPLNWKTFADSKAGISFKYPEPLGTKYIQSQEWPPKAEISSEAFACKSGGKEIMEGGMTKEETIAGTRFCITKMSEGAAGSIYTTYTYAMAFGTATARFSFVLRFPQCYNYDKSAETECLLEEKNFDINSLVGQIVESFAKI